MNWPLRSVRMVGKAVTVTLLLILKGHQGQECPDSTDHVVGLSGKSLWLRSSSTQTEADSVRWKRNLFSTLETYVILTWKNASFPALRILYNSFDFNTENLALHIKVAKPQDSGLYQLEVTKKSGEVCTMHFKIFIFDRVEKPHIQVQWKALGEGICQVALSCLVSRDDNVNYTWYRGSKLISMLRNVTFLEKRSDANDSNTYTCNVSNPVSWASHTLDLTQDCQSSFLKSRFLPFVATIMILVPLFVGTLTWFCVWKRKRKQSQTRPKEFLTIYEDIKDPRIRRNQSSASTSQETVGTVYSVIQPCRQSGPTKKHHSPSFSCTIYEEVGKRYPKAHNPARLSRKELESFDIFHP